MIVAFYIAQSCETRHLTPFTRSIELRDTISPVSDTIGLLIIFFIGPCSDCRKIDKAIEGPNTRIARLRSFFFFSINELFDIRLNNGLSIDARFSIRITHRTNKNETDLYLVFTATITFWSSWTFTVVDNVFWIEEYVHSLYQHDKLS